MDTDQFDNGESYAQTVDFEQDPQEDHPADSSEGLILVLIARPNGRPLGKRHHLTPGVVTEIGRSSECELDFPDVLSMSRVHARIGRDSEGVWVQDLESTNGTFINHEKIDKRCYLKSGDRLQCGEVHFKFLDELDVEAAYYETLHQLALQDGLTEIANKRLFDDELKREFARARRHHRRLSLVIFDIDGFKQINDEHGHLCGDFVLQQIARIGRREMRREELLGRLGGDEFGILSPEVEADGAVVLAERLRSAIAARRFSADFITEQLEVTCSFGVAQLTPEMPNPEAFFSAADNALYQSKSGGRNRVTVFKTTPSA
jgi:diguanylate cyclase (GGDEF)-like protein